MSDSKSTTLTRNQAHLEGVHNVNNMNPGEFIMSSRSHGVKADMQVIAIQEVIVKDLLESENKFNRCDFPRCMQCHNVAHTSQSRVFPPTELKFTLLVNRGQLEPALDLVSSMVTPARYPSAHILQSILQMILDFPRHMYSYDPIVKASEKLCHILDIHPPCSGSDKIRQMYSATFVDRIPRYEGGIFVTVLNNIYTILTENRSINSLYQNKVMLKTNLIILGYIIEILEHDMILWIKKNCYDGNFINYQNSYKTLVPNFFWPADSPNTVGENLETIIKLSIICIKYQISYSAHINRLLNVSILNFLFQERNKTCYFSNTHQADVLGNVFLKYLLTEPVDTVIEVIDKIKPLEIQSIVAEKILLRINPLKRKNDRKNVIMDIISNRKWTRYQGIHETYEMPHYTQIPIIQFLYTSVPLIPYENVPDMVRRETNYARPVTLQNIKKISRLHFLTLFCQCLNYFEKSHKIKEIEKVFQRQMEIADTKDPALINIELSKLTKLNLINTCLYECLSNVAEYASIKSEISSLRSSYTDLDEMLKVLPVYWQNAAGTSWDPSARNLNGPDPAQEDLEIITYKPDL